MIVHLTCLHREQSSLNIYMNSCYIYFLISQLKKTDLLALFSLQLCIKYHIFLLLSCQQSSLPVHLHQWSSQKSQETPSTWSAASGAAPTARWVMWWPGPASHLRAGRRSSNRRPPSRPPPLSSWTASTSVWGTRSEAGAAVVKHDLCWVHFSFKVRKKRTEQIRSRGDEW